MHGHTGNDEANTNHLGGMRDLSQEDKSDHSGRRWQQRDQQRVRPAGEPLHGHLIADVRDHRGADADSSRREQQLRASEGSFRRPNSDGKCDQ
jgi:hypothetical protein